MSFRIFPEGVNDNLISKNGPEEQLLLHLY